MTRYLVITLEDAKEIAAALPPGRIRDRLTTDTGADMEEIARLLKGQAVCVACSHESMQAYCQAPRSNKLGRRLARLLERARGERAPGDLPVPEEPSR